MKKNANLLLLFLISLCMNVFAQDKGISEKNIPDFKNQGEQEDYWTKQFFQKQYKGEQFEIFPGKVTATNNAFVFSDDSLFVNSQNAMLNVIFLRGLLYPSLIGGNNIHDLEELKFVEKSPQQKRFKFLLYQKGLLNPTVCFFELTDINATQASSLIEFIRNAKLTFFKQGWIMI